MLRISAERRRDRLDTPARVERIGTERNAAERIAWRGGNRVRGVAEQPGERFRWPRGGSPARRSGGNR